MTAIKRMIRQLLHRGGYDIKQFNPHEATRPQGRICRLRHDGVEMLFFVSDETDNIMTHYHRKGLLYEEDELVKLEEAYGSGDIIDIGANVGNHTVYMAKKFPASRVVAFEPGGRQATILRINLAINELCDRVEVRQMALSDRNGQAHMVLPTAHNLGSMRVSDGPDGEAVAMRRGDEILAGRSVGLIKIDAERHEREVLTGLTETIRSSRPVIFVEDFDDNRAGVERLLADFDYAVRDRFCKPDGTRNLICVPADAGAARQDAIAAPI